MGITMRFLAIGFAAALLLTVPFAAPSKACEGYVAADVLAAKDAGQAAFAQAGKADAAVKKPAKKKMAMKKKPKENVEYMRAVPMAPEGK